MAEHFGFFDAVQDPNGLYDREYNAEQFTIPFDALITNGVVRSAFEQLEVVTSGSNMVSQIKSGIAFIEGHHYLNDGIVELTHDVEALGMNRIDRVVIRKDSNPESRYVKAFIRKGLPSTNPVPPTLTRNEFVYEISLAQVRIVGGQGFISTITDERGAVNIGPWAGSNILPSYDDNLLAQHVNNKEIHVTSADKSRWDNKVNKAGDTMTGDLTINKGIPRLVLKPVVSPVDDTKRFDVFYNANGANNFGVAINKDNKGVMIINSNEDVQFWHPLDGWFSIQNLKSSVSSGKSEVANATTQMGAPTAVNAEFATIANNIRLLRGYATGSRTVAASGSLAVTGLTFEPKVVIAVNTTNGKHLYFERLSTIADGYVLSVMDYGIPPGVAGETQSFVRRRSDVGITATSFSIPVREAGTYTYYVYG